MQVRHQDLLRERLALLMDNHKIADVVFVVGREERDFPCHRMVFAAQSKVRPPGAAAGFVRDGCLEIVTVRHNF